MFEPSLKSNNLADYIGVIDIGSSSIRLVIFKTMGRFPFPLFNERVTCRLGEGLEPENILQPERIKIALETLDRFSHILQSLPNLSVKIIATAATRRAQNAKDFLIPAQGILNHKIEVLKQEEEARLVSLGLLSNFNICDGLIADLGGGSLELIHVRNRKTLHSISLDIGHLSIKSQAEIFEMCTKVEWLSHMEGLNLYGVGGSFRALGSAYIHKTKYPLGMIHALSISRIAANSLLNKIIAEPFDLAGIPKGRHFSMPKASEIIKCLLSITNVKNLVISGTSIRDGLIAREILEQTELNHHTKRDPLHVACSEIAAHSLRFSILNKNLFKFIEPCISIGTTYMENLNTQRLVQAACLLSEICWDEEPSMRANLAFEKINALPIYSLSHPERLWISITLFHRYNGVKSIVKQPFSADFILTKQQQKYALFIGLGLRLGLNFSAGINKNLNYIKLQIRQKTLICEVTNSASSLFTSQIENRLINVANTLSLCAKISYVNE